jgi:hypothetical protein
MAFKLTFTGNGKRSSNTAPIHRSYDSSRFSLSTVLRRSPADVAPSDSDTSLLSDDLRVDTIPEIDRSDSSGSSSSLASATHLHPSNGPELRLALAQAEAVQQRHLPEEAPSFRQSVERISDEMEDKHSSKRLRNRQLLKKLVVCSFLLSYTKYLVKFSSSDWHVKGHRNHDGCPVNREISAL